MAVLLLGTRPRLSISVKPMAGACHVNAVELFHEPDGAEDYDVAVCFADFVTLVLAWRWF